MAAGARARGIGTRLIIGVLILTLGQLSVSSAEAGVTTIEVLSNRADLISGGDALVAITPPDGVDPATIAVDLDGTDLTGDFAVRENGRFEGLVTGLAVGENHLTATLPDESGATIIITNHPNGGPVFSGPQVQPWQCQASAVDAQCNQPATYRYQYKADANGSWQTYDPQNPPAQVATTTTDQGNTVPLIIRIETGYQARDQYQIAALWDPAHADAAPWNPQPGYNGKVLITHGASCGTDHQSGSAPGVTGGSADVALARGFAVMSTALNNAGHNCNIITQAESMVMAKERIVETLGPIRYTIGTGCSGGSLTQQQVANAYPGLYQGILPQCSFPDAWSTGQQLVDYHLVRRYVENPTRWAPGVVWTPAEIAAVEGHPNHVNSIVLDSLYLISLGDPTTACAGVPASQRYSRETMTGHRCTLADYMINVFGETQTPQNPAHAGKGFAGRPLDNVGVRYGLQALFDGLITPAQFVDLNAKIGGADLDINYTTERTAADQPALRNAYRSGAINTGTHLDEVAIIDLRGPDHGAFHDAYRTWAIRARLEREHGTSANHVIWFGHVPLLGDANYTIDGLLAIDEWLAAVEADGSDAPLAQKIIDNRPADLQDRCSQIPGVEAVEVPGLGQVCRNVHVQSRYGTPRMVAGEGVETDINKCVLVSHRRTDYYPVEFTDTQWAALDAAFPSGVCDFSQRGVDMIDTVPWQTYQDGANGPVVTGGVPLGDAPVSVAF